jgi:hypothetical protein
MRSPRLIHRALSRFILWTSKHVAQQPVKGCCAAFAKPQSGNHAPPCSDRTELGKVQMRFAAMLIDGDHAAQISSK